MLLGTGPRIVGGETPLDYELPRAAPSPLPGVRYVIAVASSKGGVGKTTVAVHLALALAEAGGRVGVLDADFDGPSVPQILGGVTRPVIRNDRIALMEARNVQVMSHAYLTEPGQPVIWHGPLLRAMMLQMLFEVDWGMLDFLVVDLPPGAGDVPVALVQSVALTGVVVVTTPQRVAVVDVVRCIEMFQMAGVPVLGVVENMSYLLCPDSGRRLEVFGCGGGEWLAKQFDISLLGQIPLDPAICEGGDLGQPATGTNSPIAQAFRELAEKVVAQVPAAVA